jgi:uncharacterized protein YqeY
MQERFTEALKEAVKSQDKIRISTLAAHYSRH